MFSFGPLETVTETEVSPPFDTHVLSTILTTQEAVGTFGKDGGSVINVSTVSSTNPVPNYVVYSASKSAVDAITTALANELAGRKIRVNAIAARHGGNRRPRGDGIEGETARHVGATFPMGRLGQPEDMSASPCSSFPTSLAG